MVTTPADDEDEWHRTHANRHIAFLLLTASLVTKEKLFAIKCTRNLVLNEVGSNDHDSCHCKQVLVQIEMHHAHDFGKTRYIDSNAFFITIVCNNR